MGGNLVLCLIQYGKIWGSETLLVGTEMVHWMGYIIKG